MTNPLSARNRLFWRTSLWPNGRPNALMGWLAAGTFVFVVGKVAFLTGDFLFGFLLLCVGFVWAFGTATFALAMGQVTCEKQVYERLKPLLEAYTHLAYPYGTQTFAMTVYHLRLDPQQGAVVEKEDPWGKSSHEDGPVLLPLPAWVSAAAEAFTHVDGVRVMPSTTRFLTFAERDKPVPTAHERLALRAAVHSLLPPGVVPDWD